MKVEFNELERETIIDNCFGLIESDYMGDKKLTKKNLNNIEVSKKTFYMIEPTEIKILISIINKLKIKAIGKG